MTIIAHRVDDNNATMERWAPFSPLDEFDDCQVDARMCVGVKGRQGGKGGRARRQCIFAHAHRAIGVTDFFWRHDVGGSMHNNSY